MIRNPENNNLLYKNESNMQKPKEVVVHTSVSLRECHKKIVIETAEKYNIDPNKLMVLLLRYGYKRHLVHAKENNTIVYQPSTKDITIVNLYLGQRDYERNLDSRRFCKFGVSWMLTFAIIHYLMIVVNRMLNSSGEVLNNYLIPQTYIIKQSLNRIKFCSTWYPFRE